MFRTSGKLAEETVSVLFYVDFSKTVGGRTDASRHWKQWMGRLNRCVDWTDRELCVGLRESGGDVIAAHLNDVVTFVRLAPVLHQRAPPLHRLLLLLLLLMTLMLVALMRDAMTLICLWTDGCGSCVVVELLTLR